MKCYIVSMLLSPITLPFNINCLIVAAYNNIARQAEGDLPMIPIDMDDEMLEELVLLQKTILKHPDRNNFSVDFNYDWKDYYLHTLNDRYSPLKKKRIRANIHNKIHRDNWKDYAVESVWFGRNGVTFSLGVTYEDI